MACKKTELISAINSFGAARATGDSNLVNFTPYDQITKEQAIGWVKTALGDEQVASIEAALEEQIQQKLNPTSAAGVPW